MVKKASSRRLAPVVLGVAALGVALLPAAPRNANAASAKASPIYLTAMQNFHTVLTRNFSPFSSTTANDFTLGGIYEPLAIMTPAGGGHTYPWLATGWKYIDGNKTLLITIRHGVRWSDGVPFTAKDVLFTFKFGAVNADHKVNGALDQIGLTTGQTTSVNLVGSDKVAIHLKTVNTTGLPGMLSNVKILPEHIWATVKHPDVFTNPNPVGTGPFTQVLNFSGQGFILGKNPYYWQPGKPAFDGIRLTPYTGNDSADLAMAHGDLDWTDNFVPNIQQVYVNKDPQHYHYFYDTAQPPNVLFFNDEKYPYSLPGFRKAMSYAIDRKKIYLLAEYGYEIPENALGIQDEFPNWVDKSLLAPANEVTTYNPAKAKALLVQLGFKYNNGQLYDPKGKRVSFQLSVPNSFSDWILAMRIMARNFQDIGIDATSKPIDETSFYDKANKGLVDAALYWTNNGFTPYDFYYGYMSRESYVSTGQDATVNGQTNYERWWSPEATALFAQFRQTTDNATRHAIMNKLQKIQLDNMPFIPVMAGALWYTYSTKNFVGWPTQANSYVYGQSVVYPDDVKVLTTIAPVH